MCRLNHFQAHRPQPYRSLLQVSGLGTATSTLGGQISASVCCFPPMTLHLPSRAWFAPACIGLPHAPLPPRHLTVAWQRCRMYNSALLTTQSLAPVAVLWFYRHTRTGTEEHAIGMELGNGWFNPAPLRFWGQKNIRDGLPTGVPMVTPGAGASWGCHFCSACAGSCGH